MTHSHATDQAIENLADFSTLDFTQPAVINHFLDFGLKRAEALRHQEPRFHTKSLAALLTMTINDLWQAFIEWAYIGQWQRQYLQWNPVIHADGQTVHYQAWEYPFRKNQSREEQAQAIQRYKSQILAFSDSIFKSNNETFKKLAEQYRDWIPQQRQKLEAAVRHNNTLSLETILDEPGDRLESASLRLLFLQNLLLEEPSFLEQDEVAISATDFPTSFLKEREKLFLAWLEDAKRYAPEGWLTLDLINQRNSALNSGKKVFRPKRSDSVEVDTVRQLVAQLRKYPEYRNAIESMPHSGKAWRLKDT